MTSKAAIKKRRKRAKLKRGGRPSIPNALRTEAGRISRSSAEKNRQRLESEAQIKNTALTARSTKQGISIKHANDPLWGYSLGQLMKLERISKAEHDSGVEIGIMMSNYYGLTGIPFPSARAQNLFAVGGHQGETTTEQAKAARSASNRYMLFQGEVLRSGRKGREVHTTLRNVCLLDYDTQEWPNHMINLLKNGLKLWDEFNGVDK